MNKRIALCIGNNSYEHLSSLSCAINDADVMGDVLMRLGYDSIVAHDLNRSDMGKTIFDFSRKISEYDACIFFYAGHGFEIDSQNLLIPTDFEYDMAISDRELIYNAFPLNDLLEQLKRFPNVVKIVILDACRSIRGIRGGLRGFNSVVSPEGSLIAFSTSPGATAFEIDEADHKHGRYTKTLLRYIEADFPVEDIFKKVRQVMNRETRGRQIPWEHTSLLGYFSFDNRDKERNTVYLNYIDSLKVTSERRTRQGYTNFLQEGIDYVENYPVLDVKNPHLPKITTPVGCIQEKIKAIYTTMENNWEDILNPSIDYSFRQICDRAHYIHKIVYKIHLNQCGILCMAFIQYLVAENVVGISHQTVKTYDLNTGSELSLRDLLKCSDSEVIEKVRLFVDELKTHEPHKINEDFSVDNYKTLESLKWYVNEKGIYIYFDVHEISISSDRNRDFPLTSEVYYTDRNGEKELLEFENQNLRQFVVDYLTEKYWPFYQIVLNRDIGKYHYEIMALGPTPGRITTFWLIKCVKYKKYNQTYLEEMVNEIIRMKLNYEILTGKDILAILYIVWDEDSWNSMIDKCQIEFDNIMKRVQVDNVYLETQLKVKLGT